MSGRLRLGCAALVGAAIACPAGVIVGGSFPPHERPAVEKRGTAGPAPKPQARNFYSPRFRSDPYVLDQQRQVVEALELSCRQFRERCREAAEARRRIEEAQ